jgi:hypothetical protein
LSPPFEISIPPQPPGTAGQELVDVAGIGRLRLHDYERIYAVPGLYEALVQQRLGCRTPDRMAALLAAAAPPGLRVLDAGAGNGVSGEALAAHGLDPVVGIDLLPEARAAALRDRPGLYGTYLVADLAALGAEEEAAIRAARPQALACVGSVGAGHLPPEAVAAALTLLEPGALVAYAYDIELGADPLGDLFAGAEELHRDRALHRHTVTGGRRIWEAAVVRPA